MYRHEGLNHGYDTLVRTHIRGFTGPSELEQRDYDTEKV